LYVPGLRLFDVSVSGSTNTGLPPESAGAGEPLIERLPAGSLFGGGAERFGAERTIGLLDRGLELFPRVLLGVGVEACILIPHLGI